LAGNLIGLKDVRVARAMMRTSDVQGIELDKFHSPDAIRFGPVDAPVNTLGSEEGTKKVSNPVKHPGSRIAPQHPNDRPTRRHPLT
jgi:hypothetical protein